VLCVSTETVFLQFSKKIGVCQLDANLLVCEVHHTIQQGVKNFFLKCLPVELICSTSQLTIRTTTSLHYDVVNEVPIEYSM